MRGPPPFPSPLSYPLPLRFSSLIFNAYDRMWVGKGMTVVDGRAGAVMKKKTLSIQKCL